MALTRYQKKYLKKNLQRLPLAKITDNLDVSEKEILNFLKSRWRKEKYQKYVEKQAKYQKSLAPKTQLKNEIKTGRFNLKKYLTRNRKVFVFLAFLVFAVYFNSLGNDFVSDDMGIKNSPNINEISYFWKPPYFTLKLRLLIIFLTHKVFGMNPIFYRLSNIFFHLGSTWIIFILISLFFKSPIPLITTSVFAVHPILTEGVAWIAGGGYVYSAFFALLSFLIYIYADNLMGKKAFKFWLFSVFLFYLALSLSEKLIIFPIILSLYELCSRKLKNNWPKLVPFWLIGGFWTLHLAGRLGQRVTALETDYYLQPGTDNPFIQIPTAVASYLELIFWPKNLTLYHSEMSFGQGEYFLRLGVFILFLISIIYFFKKDRRIFFWLSFFLVSLLPFLTPLRISWIVAERYVYLGSLGIFVIIALILQKINEVFKNQKVSYALLAIILTALSIRTIIRNTDWKNQDTLWLAAAKTSPSSPQNHNNLGDYYGRQGNFEKAVEEFKKAIELNPNYGDAFHNLANTYQQMERVDEAIENYQKAASINPNLWQSYQNLAAIYFDQKKLDLAEENLKKAIAVNPQNANLYTNLGIIYLQLNLKEKAKEQFQKTLQLDPQNQKAKQLWLNLEEKVSPSP